jgi:hypothetical protein
MELVSDVIKEKGFPKVKSRPMEVRNQQIGDNLQAFMYNEFHGLIRAKLFTRTVHRVYFDLREVFF